MDMLKEVLPTIFDLATKLDGSEETSARIRVKLEDSSRDFYVVTANNRNYEYDTWPFAQYEYETLCIDNTPVEYIRVFWDKTSKLYKRRRGWKNDWWRGCLELNTDHILYSHSLYFDDRHACSKCERIEWTDPQCWDKITKILTSQDSSSEDQLRAMVKATNAANAEANRLDSELKIHFAQFVGQQVLKKNTINSKNGSLLARIVARMPSLPNEHETLIQQMTRITKEHRREAEENLEGGVDVKIDLRCRRKLRKLSTLGTKVRSRKSLCFHVTASAVLPDGFCLYSKSTVTVGELQDGVLVSVHPRHDLRTDYTCEEIKAKRDKVAKAKKALNEAKSALYPFEEYDR